MDAPSSHMWYVKVGGSVWGPYPEARVASFVAEGRVRPDSPISPWPQGPFAPAADSAEFASMLRPANTPPLPPSRTKAAAVAAVAAATPLLPNRPAPTLNPAPALAPAMDNPEPTASPARAVLRPLLVWAALSASSVAAFQAALASVGPGMAIRPGLWLVQSPVSPAVLRNRLSRRLSATDVLLVVQAPLDQAAWFNLDPERDRELRRIWTPT